MSHIKFSIIYCTFLLVLAHTCEASIVIPDSGFEDQTSSSFWTTFGIANSDAAAPGIDRTIEGTETLQLSGTGDGSFSGVFQDIAVDGISISVGDQVAVTGILGHTYGDPLSGLNSAFLEVSFVDSAGVEFLDSMFQSARISSSSLTDIYQTGVTTFATVPSNAVAVRVKAVFEQLSFEGLSGSARFDNLGLVAVVPEPASGFMLAAGFLAILARRRR